MGFARKENMNARNDDPAYTTHILRSDTREVSIKVFDDESLGAYVVTTVFGFYSDGYNSTRVEDGLTREDARAIFTKAREDGLTYAGPWRSSRFAGRGGSVGVSS